MSRYTDWLNADGILASLVDRPRSEWSKNKMAEGINFSLGDAQFQLPHVKPEDVLVKRQSGFAKYLTSQGIQASIGEADEKWWSLLKPDPELVRAATPILSQLLGGRAQSPTSQASLSSLLAQAKTQEEREAILRAYHQRVSKQQDLGSTWAQIKWPVMVGTGIAGVALIAWVVKSKEAFYEEGRFGVRT